MEESIGNCRALLRQRRVQLWQAGVRGAGSRACVRVKSVACACVHFGGLCVVVASRARNKRLQSTAVETRVRRKKRNHPWQKAPPQVPNLTAQRISGHMSNWFKHTLTLKLKKTNDETRSSHSSDSTTTMNCGFEVEPWTSKNK